MPFVDDAEPAGLAPQIAEPLKINVPVPSFGRMFEAAMGRENTVGSIATSLSQPSMAPFDASFDPWRNIQGYEDQARAFIGANDEIDVMHIKSRIDDERRRREALDAGGWSPMALLAQIGAGVLDPVNAIPVLGQARAVARVGRAAEGALRVGATGAVSQTAAEGVLQGTQIDRTLGESAVNVGAATFLGGVLGGAVGALGRPLTREFADQAMREAGVLEREMAGNADGVRAPDAGQSIGAAAVRDTTLEQETFVSALGAERVLARTSPMTRTGTSPSVDVRRFGEELADQVLLTKKNLEDIPTPTSVESRMRLYRGPLAEGLLDVDDLFVRYRMGRDPQMMDIARLTASDMVRSRSGALSREEFNEAVGRAMRRDDASDIPEVAQAAAAMRKKVFDPPKERAIEAGLLPEDVSVDTALSYFTRVYNTQKIVAQRPRFEEILTDWLATTKAGSSELAVNLSKALAGVTARREAAEINLTARRAAVGAAPKGEAAALRGEIAALQKELDKLKVREERLGKTAESHHTFAGIEDIDLQDIARQITDTLLHAAPNRANYTPIPLTRGPLRERTLSIADELIEDFLESDVQHIAKIYTNTMAADVELTTAFGRADMEQQLDKVREGYAVLREGVTDERKLKRLNDRMQADLRDLAGIRDRLRGTYALPDNPDGFANRAFHVVRDLNYLRLLGGMTLAALADIGRAPMVHGMTNVFRDGVVPMLTDFRQFRLAGHEAQLAGTANDMVLDTRSMAMADMLDDYGRWSKYERGIQGMASKFGLVTLMAPWNSAMKQFVAVVSQTRSLRAIEQLAAGGTVAQAERTRLAHLGLGEEMIGRIASEFKTHGKRGATSGEAWWANTAAWTDHAAADDFRAALSKEVDMVIVTPGQERPFWSTGGWGNTGKLIGQFKGFAMASTQRVMLTGLQQRDMATLNGVILMTGLGMVSYAIRQQLNPNSQPLPDPGTPEGLARWLREGVDRAGLTGWMFEAHNMVEKASGGNIGLGAITGGPPMSRYASRSVAESIAGPTFGTGLHLTTKLFHAATSGEWAASDTSAGRQMLLYQNVFYFRRLFDEAEHGLNRALGVPEKTH